MNHFVLWSLGLALAAALLVSAHKIVEQNHAALSGGDPGHPAAFYGH